MWYLSFSVWLTSLSMIMLFEATLDGPGDYHTEWKANGFLSRGESVKKKKNTEREKGLVALSLQVGWA